jgi:tight adherence protein C
MDPVGIVLIAFLVVTAVTFATAAVLLRSRSAVHLDRLRPELSEDGSRSILRWDERPRAAWQRLLERVGRALQPHDAAKLGRYRERLVWAGYSNPRAVLLYFGAKAACAIVFGSLYGAWGMLVQRAVPNLLLVSVVLGLLGLFVPDLWLNRRIRARQKLIVNALPDVMDLLVVCVEAGMGFDAAVARVAEQPEGRDSPLQQELMRMHLEIRAGRPREEAMRALGERTPSQELKAVIGGFVQAERLGSPLGRTLRVHSESVRVQRRHRAEERAQLAPLKMIFPTVLFLMPSFFLVVMAPSLLGMVKLLGRLGK